MSKIVELYSCQPDAIYNSIQSGITHYAKLKCIKEKYGHDIAPIFTSAYSWFVRQSEHFNSRPEAAESPIWVYYDLYNIEKHPSHKILKLAIPVDQVIFFKMSDWNSVLNQRFIGKTEEETNKFNDKLVKQGISYEGDIFRTPFYPQLKNEVVKSWLNLFRYHEPTSSAIAQGNQIPIKDVQAAIWQLPKTWMKEVVD